MKYKTGEDFNPANYVGNDDDLALWKASRQDKLSSASIADMSKNSAYKILDALADNEWHHTNELTEIIARFGPRILYLREEGYVIQDVPADGGHLYR